MNDLVVSKRSVTILRIMLSGIFLVAGLNHVVAPQGVAGRLTTSSMYEYFPAEQGGWQVCICNVESELPESN